MARLCASNRGERRTAFAGCQMTPSERAVLDAAAAAAGLAVSDYIRAAVFSRPVPTSGGREKVAAVRDLAAEIARVGNNLNQLAHRANAAGQIRSEDGLQAELARLAAVMEKIIAL